MLRLSTLVLLSLLLVALLSASHAEGENSASEEDLVRLLAELQRNYNSEGGAEMKSHAGAGKPHHPSSHEHEEHDEHEEHHDGPHHGREMNENLNEQTYAFRSDMFEEVRWQDVYVDEYMARDDTRVMNSITPEQQTAIVDLHNELRRKEGASNMEILRWNPKLAQLGQTWSQRCVFEHGQPPYSEGNIGHKHLGQNIYAHTDPKMTVEQAVQAWYDEKKDYQYNSISCNAGKICGHYTAVTWAKTTDVGCGMTFCPSISGLTKAHFIVCNYAPAGNFQGERPFLKGSACSQCDSGKFYCNKDLCDKSCNSEGGSCQCKAACQKGGKKTSGCKCECPAGSAGPDCSLQCADRDLKCGANPGYPPFLCTMNDANWSFVKDKCPKMCKVCSKKRSLDEESSVLKRLMLAYKAEEEMERENELNSN